MPALFQLILNIPSNGKDGKKYICHLFWSWNEFRQSTKKNPQKQKPKIMHNSLEFILGKNYNKNALRECFIYLLSVIYAFISFEH